MAKKVTVRAATVRPGQASVQGDRGVEEVIRRTINFKLADIKLKGGAAQRMLKMVSDRQEKAAQVSANHYSGMLKAVGDILAQPPSKLSHYVRPARPRRFWVPIKLPGTGVTIPLEPGRQTVRAWDGLSPAYAASIGKRWQGMPKSKTFWRKTGELAGAYAAWYAGAMGDLKNLKKYRQGVIQILPKAPTKGYTGAKVPLATYRFTMTHPKLSSGILDFMLRRSFVETKAQDVIWNIGYHTEFQTYWLRMPHGTFLVDPRIRDDILNKRGLDRMNLAERTRPMFARFAAAAGRKETAALRKLLKPR